MTKPCLAFCLVLIPFGPVAAADKRPQIASVFAYAELAIDEQTVTTCDGVDGIYTLIKIRAHGPMASTDPRMEGMFYADAKIFFNPFGHGVGRDDFTIEDAFGRVKVRGLARTVDAPGEGTKALVTADLNDGSVLWAESNVTLPAPGTLDPVIIEYGNGAPYTVFDRAVIVNNDCEHLFFGADQQ